MRARNSCSLARAISVVYLILVSFILALLCIYVIYLSQIHNPPCTPCVDGLSQSLVTSTLTNNTCNRTNVSSSFVDNTTIRFNFSVSSGCPGPIGKRANVTILIKNNATNTTVTEGILSNTANSFSFRITANTTYYTQKGPTGLRGPTSTVQGPQGDPGDQGPPGIPGVLPTRTFRVVGPAKTYIPITVPPNSTIFSYTLIGGGGGGGGGCAFGAGRGGGGGGGSGYRTQGILVLDKNSPPSMTIRLGSGGWGGYTGGGASDGEAGYPTQLLMNGAPFAMAKGGNAGARCSTIVGLGGYGGQGGDGGYGGGGGGCTNGYVSTGGQSQLLPDTPQYGFEYQRGNSNDGGSGAGPNAGAGGLGWPPDGRTGGGGGGGGLLPYSGGAGSNFYPPDQLGADGGGENAGNGQYGGGGGGSPGFSNGNSAGLSGNGGTGYIEYIFF